MQNNTTDMNSTNVQVASCELRVEQILLICLYSIVVFVGVIGNGFVCYVFTVLQSKPKNVTETILLYLAVTDLLSSLWTPFIFMYWIITCESEWHFGQIGCKLIPLMSRVFINVSAGIILILAIDRCRAICRPFVGQFTKKCVHFSVSLVVIFSFICEVYYIDALAVVNNRCRASPVSKFKYHQYTIGVLMSRDILYFLVFSVTTFLTSHALWKRDNFILSERFSSQELGRIVHMVIIMQLVFLVLVTPRDILHVVFSISWLDGEGIPYTTQLRSLNEFLKVVQTANSCANVFIYSKLHDRFRDHFNSELFHLFNNDKPNVSDANFQQNSIQQLQGKVRRGLSTGPLLEETSLEEYN